MNCSSGVSPARNFSASLSKSSNSRSRIGMMCPGTFSITSGLSSDPRLPPFARAAGSAGCAAFAVFCGGAAVGSILGKYQNPVGFPPLSAGCGYGLTTMRMRAGRLSVARHEKIHPEVRKRDRHAGPLRGSRRHLIRGRDDLRQRRPERLADQRRRQERVAEEPRRRQRIAHRQRPEERLASRGRLQGGRPTDRLARPMDPHLDATAQADLVRAGEVSPRELVEASIERIEALNGDLNAVIHPLFEQALDTEPADGPFRGVPLLLKDLACHSAGHPFHEGMTFLRDLGWVEPEDTWLARRFREAGFIIMGKTNTPELGILPTTEPRAYGATCNPWNTSRSTGGSSGGSAPARARPYTDELGADPGRLRIGLMTKPPGGQFEAHPDCVAAAQDAARLLESLGHDVETSHPEALDEEAYIPNFLVRWTSGVAFGLRYWERRTGRMIGPDDVEPVTWALAEQGRTHGADAYLEAIEYAQAVTRRGAEWWAAGNNLLLTPTLALPPAELGTIGIGEGDNPMMPIVHATPFAIFTAGFNTSGQPAISLPLWWNAEGLPLGVQLVAEYGREDVLIRVAAQLEQARPWAERRPPMFAAAA